jgi:hypothetical protein
MGNLTSAQLDAIVDGQPIKQRFWMRVPLIVDHSTYFDVLFEEGIHQFHTLTMLEGRVIRAGKRKHVVWNPHPNVPVKARALQWQFEVANKDNYFDNRTDGIFYYLGIYRCEPQECFVVHKVYVWEPVAEAWSEITHMAFTGRVLRIEYDDSATADKYSHIQSAIEPVGVADTALITCQQTGVWDALLRTFTKDDGDAEMVDDPGGLGEWYYDFT